MPKIKIVKTRTNSREKVIDNVWCVALNLLDLIVLLCPTMLNTPSANLSLQILAMESGIGLGLQLSLQAFQSSSIEVKVSFVIYCRP